jgi:hypothetical protein
MILSLIEIYRIEVEAQDGNLNNMLLIINKARAKDEQEHGRENE